jgi:hypothetical protein
MELDQDLPLADATVTLGSTDQTLAQIVPLYQTAELAFTGILLASGVNPSESARNGEHLLDANKDLTHAHATFIQHAANALETTDVLGAEVATTLASALITTTAQCSLTPAHALIIWIVLLA